MRQPRAVVAWGCGLLCCAASFPGRSGKTFCVGMGKPRAPGGGRGFLLCGVSGVLCCGERWGGGVYDVAFAVLVGGGRGGCFDGFPGFSC